MKFAASLFLAAIVCALLLPLLALASSGACYSITDADQRTLCLAREHRDPSRCYAIQAQNLRAQCRAEVRR